MLRKVVASLKRYQGRVIHHFKVGNNPTYVGEIESIAAEEGVLVIKMTQNLLVDGHQRIHQGEDMLVYRQPLGELSEPVAAGDNGVLFTNLDTGDVYTLMDMDIKDF